MSDGHADNIAATSDPAQTPAPPVDPALWSRPDLAPALATHDIGALFRLLGEMGIGQRRIAALTRQHQSAVSEIVSGRPVLRYDVLVRITTGLGIPPQRMGLSFWGPDGRWYGPEGAYGGRVTVTTTPEGVSAAMLRRHLIAQGGIILAGAPVAQLGELLDDLGDPPPVPLPSRLSYLHVAQVRDLRQRLADAGMIFGSDPQMSSAAAAGAERLLTVSGAEPVTQALMTAIAQLHIHAGRAAFDGGLYKRAMHHYARALELATESGDAYVQAAALMYAGQASVEHGHPNDGLKMLQCGQVKAWGIPPDHDRRQAVEACVLVESAMALASLGDPTAAYRDLAKGRDLWQPKRTDRTGDLDIDAALLEIDRWRLDIAQQFAAASVQRWEGISQRARTRSGIVLATIHVRAGEPRGLQLAHSAITEVTKLTSVRARHRLIPLAEALDTRPGTDARELARMARQVAA